MTEEEAKTQDCIGPPTCGRVQDGELGVYGSMPRRLCIGSACKMAWRETSEIPGGYQIGGYCGLAGKP